MPDALAPDDSFLRRIAFASMLRNSIVSWKAFKARSSDDTLSFTLQNEVLKDQDNLDQFPRYNRFPESGDLPGICKLTLEDLTGRLVPPLPPERTRDSTDTEYGHLHFATAIPTKDQMIDMAKLATDHGILRSFVKAKAL